MDFIFHSLGMSSTGIKILGDLVEKLEPILPYCPTSSRSNLISATTS